MKIISLEESADFATLDTKKLFSKIKFHELSKKGRPNHDASLTSKALITSARVGGHDANPINITVSSTLEFALSSLAVTFDEQYKNILDDEIALRSVSCTSSARRGGDPLEAVLTVATPPTSSLTAPRGRYRLLQQV
jgi:hypothetical protein